VFSEDATGLPHAGEPGAESSDGTDPGAARAERPTLGAVSGRENTRPERERSDRQPEAAPPTAEPIEPAALRDAEAIAERVALDEKAADEERQRLAVEGLPILLPPADLLFRLLPDELLHAERRAALLERPREGPPSGGMLYLTSRRLVHVGNERIEEIRLSDIRDMAVAMERLLLVELTDGSDLAIEVDRPRLLRVQVAAARSGLREVSS